MNGRIRNFAAALLAAGLAAHACADVVQLAPDRDNTLFSTADGSTSSGAGPSVFSGRTGGGTLQRAVLRFDVASAVPAGSTVLTAQLTLHLIQGGGMGEQTHTLHRLLADWGEGTSSSGGGAGAPATPGDATWLHTFYPDAFWSAEGGDFEAEPAASSVAGTTSGPVTWGPAPELAADVQAWLDDPASNFGWLVHGNEDAANSSRKFASREAADPTLRPVLAIEYLPPPPPCPADLNGNGRVGVIDLILLLVSWGPCPGCPADLDGDGAVRLNDLLAVLTAWGPCPEPG